MARVIQQPEVDGEWERVHEALSDPRWDFRTVDGIARSTGLSEEEVAAILDRYKDEVRQSVVPDRHGRALYTLRSRPKKAQEWLAEIRAYLAKSL
jgi:hypothetical protein